MADTYARIYSPGRSGRAPISIAPRNQTDASPSVPFAPRTTVPQGPSPAIVPVPLPGATGVAPVIRPVTPRPQLPSIIGATATPGPIAPPSNTTMTPVGSAGPSAIPRPAIQMDERSAHKIWQDAGGDIGQFHAMMTKYGVPENDIARMHARFGLLGHALKQYQSQYDTSLRGGDGQHSGVYTLPNGERVVIDANGRKVGAPVGHIAPMKSESDYLPGPGYSPVGPTPIPVAHDPVPKTGATYKKQHDADAAMFEAGRADRAANYQQHQLDIRTNQNAMHPDNVQTQFETNQVVQRTNTNREDPRVATQRLRNEGAQGIADTRAQSNENIASTKADSAKAIAEYQSHAREEAAKVKAAGGTGNRKTPEMNFADTVDKMLLQDLRGGTLKNSEEAIAKRKAIIDAYRGATDKSANQPSGNAQYSVGQVVQTPAGPKKIVGFDTDGHPLVE